MSGCCFCLRWAVVLPSFDLDVLNSWRGGTSLLLETGLRVSISLVVDGGSSNAQTPGEGAVVWILLVAPRNRPLCQRGGCFLILNPASMSTRGFFPFRILPEVLGPSRFSSSSNVTFRLCLNLRRSCVLISLLVLAYVRPSCLPSSGRCFCLGWRTVGDWLENKNPSSMSTRGLLPDPEPGLYVNEGDPAGGSWTISPCFLVELYLPPLS